MRGGAVWTSTAPWWKGRDDEDPASMRPLKPTVGGLSVVRREGSREGPLQVGRCWHAHGDWKRRGLGEKGHEFRQAGFRMTWGH